MIDLLAQDHSVIFILKNDKNIFYSSKANNKNNTYHILCPMRPIFGRMRTQCSLDSLKAFLCS